MTSLTLAPPSISFLATACSPDHRVTARGVWSRESFREKFGMGSRLSCDLNNESAQVYKAVWSLIAYKDASKNAIKIM